ncbi:hypothetical protein PUNSTDRAFT_44686 [Punctularia strigosozonata HHB-11173 SS5]|uniref:uncharacterized protein n=1 Tax=Punctularia strigosozonata (strain HHB-11173) TaxID=741275 RepID=UPI0004417C80|nr:uncharacterized protein PUNSTDRAFT_44686 [Punctularia strigosozonata HHB-11173 SS5]EIN09316.1 hypothetical protein PUNSTDRAFT_44686 [Punctularia strigosozonata HHB-11173 SS5]
MSSFVKTFQHTTPYAANPLRIRSDVAAKMMTSRSGIRASGQRRLHDLRAEASSGGIEKPKRAYLRRRNSGRNRARTDAHVGGMLRIARDPRSGIASDGRVARTGSRTRMNNNEGIEEGGQEGALYPSQMWNFPHPSPEASSEGFNFEISVTEPRNLSFVSLALPETHPFWSSVEEPFPSALRETVKPLYKPLHIATNLGGHTYVLSSGQRCSYPVKQSAAKYGKFAYSAAFAYSVPVGDGTLEEHAGDSALLLSDDDGETWRARRKTEEFRFENDGGWLRSMWYPWADVEVETWLVPPTPAAPLWHVRVHRVRAGRKIWTAEGAWAIYGQRPDGRHLDPVDKSVEGGFGFWQEGPEARAHSRAGASAIVELGNRKQREGKVIRTDANSSLMWARAVLPTLLDTVEPTEGDVWYVTAVFGKPNIGNEKGASKGWMTEWEKRPDVPDPIRVLLRHFPFDGDVYIDVMTTGGGNCRRRGRGAGHDYREWAVAIRALKGNEDDNHKWRTIWRTNLLY